MQNSVILTPFFLDDPVLELEFLVQPGWQINQPILPDGERQRRMIVLYEDLAALVAQTAVSGRRPVSIAGDCCTTIGVLAGLQRANIQPTLIWFDAHGDFNTWETTPSGFLGGMPLAMLVGRGEQTMPVGVRLVPLPESKVILTDGRDLDVGEREAVQRSDIIHLSDVTRLLTNDLPEGPLYVHFDTDILNPEAAPAMNYRAPGGPSAVVLQQVFERLSATGRVTAVSMSSWNPELDIDGRSQAVCMELLHTLL